MRNIILWNILFPALQKLYKIDVDNIKNGVSERNICARLALHIENTMREYDTYNKTSLFTNYFADVEYNRMGNGDLKKYENSQHVPQYMVSDLLIQSRSLERNYLAVEMKKKGNHKNIEEDKKRLKSMVSSGIPESPYQCVHDTLVGTYIEYSACLLKIIVFENDNGIGKETEEYFWKISEGHDFLMLDHSSLL